MALALQNRDDVQKNSGLNALGSRRCQAPEMKRLHNTPQWFRFGMTIPDPMGLRRTEVLGSFTSTG
jgi:hypothetical protein